MSFVTSGPSEHPPPPPPYVHPGCIVRTQGLPVEAPPPPPPNKAMGGAVPRGVICQRKRSMRLMIGNDRPSVSAFAEPPARECNEKGRPPVLGVKRSTGPYPPKRRGRGEGKAAAPTRSIPNGHGRNTKEVLFRCLENRDQQAPHRRAPMPLVAWGASSGGRGGPQRRGSVSVLLTPERDLQ